MLEHCQKINHWYVAFLLIIYSSQLRPMIHVCQVFVVGGLAHGKVEADYAEEEIAISHYPLSASVVCGKICNALEHMWEVL